MWDQTAHALGFFFDHLPFTTMSSADDLTTDGDEFILALPGTVYAVYLPPGAVLDGLDLSSTTGDFEVLWFDPRNGESLQIGSVVSVTAGGVADCGLPPADPGLDWVALIRRQGFPGPIFADGFESGHTASWSSQSSRQGVEKNSVRCRPMPLRANRRPGAARRLGPR